ncbi:ankyrin repeat protein [Cooperia oncophora]
MDKPAAKSTRKPKDVKDTPESEPNHRGPNSKQLTWLRACRKGDLAECKKLLETDPDLLHYVPPHHLNYSSVHIATLGRHYELLRFFKSKNANFNATTRTGYTPLHLAAQNQDQETVRLLIREFGVDTRIHDLLGYTYEHYADWLDYPDYHELTPRLTQCGNLLSPVIGVLIGEDEPREDWYR